MGMKRHSQAPLLSRSDDPDGIAVENARERKQQMPTSDQSKGGAKEAKAPAILNSKALLAPMSVRAEGQD